MTTTNINTADERAKRLIAMGEMAITLAHEIRNPLGSMELFCTLLKQDLAGHPKALDLAEQIHLGIRALDRIISNCLRFAREIRPRKTQRENTSSVFHEILDHARPHAERHGVTVTFAEEGTLPIEADFDLLSQAFLNLVINAIDAVAMERAYRGTGDSTYSPEVQIWSIHTSPLEWSVTIRDNGIGIPSEEIGQVFDPFFSTKERGTGLGLAITHSIITAHEGMITVESAPHVGTEMRVSLPQRQRGEGKRTHKDDGYAGTTEHSHC